MTVKELKEKLENLDNEMSIGVSVKKSTGETSDPIIYVSNENKVSAGVNDGILWIDGEFDHNNAVNAEGSHR